MVRGDVQTLWHQKVQGRGFPRVTAQTQEGCTSPFLLRTSSQEILGATLGFFSPLKSTTAVYLTSPSSATVGN